MTDDPRHPSAPAHPPVHPVKAAHDDKAGPRKEYDALMKQWADSLTPASDDPMDTRKLAKPLTEEESRRLHELHKSL